VVIGGGEEESDGSGSARVDYGVRGEGRVCNLA
jgi:hypothetical protein